MSDAEEKLEGIKNLTSDTGKEMLKRPFGHDESYLVLAESSGHGGLPGNAL